MSEHRRSDCSVEAIGSGKGHERDELSDQLEFERIEVDGCC